MERLTGRKENGHAYIIGCPDFEIPKIIGMIIQRAVDKCADIEDILGDDYNLDRLRKLVEADRDGRCVVLLSNDDVYTIRGDIVNGIIKANCRDACKPPKSALKGDQHG